MRIWKLWVCEFLFELFQFFTPAAFSFLVSILVVFLFDLKNPVVVGLKSNTVGVQKQKNSRDFLPQSAS